MENYLNRANAVFCSLMVSLGVLALGNIASSFFLVGPISGSVSAREVYGFGYNYALSVSHQILHRGCSWQFESTGSVDASMPLHLHAMLASHKPYEWVKRDGGVCINS